MTRISSLWERPRSQRPRRLADWLNPTGERKVHSLVDNVYQRGYRLTRYADDWVVTCRTRIEAQHALSEAQKILAALGVTLNDAKTRIVQVSQGFEFLGYKIKRGSRRLALAHLAVKRSQKDVA